LSLSFASDREGWLSVNPTKMSRLTSLDSLGHIPSVRREQGAIKARFACLFSLFIGSKTRSILTLYLTLTSSWVGAMSCYEFDLVQCRAGIQTAQKTGPEVANCPYPMVGHGKSPGLSAEQTHRRHCNGAGAQSFGPCGFHIRQKQLNQKKNQTF